MVLGAGLDTYAFRQQSAPASLSVWEVDHPDTQDWKRDRLEQYQIETPENLHFVPVDFERDELSDCLARAGFDASRPAFFSWLGVSYYLDRADIRKLFQYLGSMAAGSQLVLDFIVNEAELNESGRAQLQALSENAARRGEPVKSTFTPGDMAEELRSAGFNNVEHLDTGSARDRYLQNRTDDLMLDGAAEFFWARI